DAPVLAPQPFAVPKPGAGEMDDAAAARQPLDRLAVVGLRVAVVAEQRARARLDAERPVGRARTRALAQAIERGGRGVRRAAANAGLDQLHERPREEPDVVVLAPALRRRERLGVAAAPVVEQGAGPLDHAQSHALTPRRRLEPSRLD